MLQFVVIGLLGFSHKGLMFKYENKPYWLRRVNRNIKNHKLDKQYTQIHYTPNFKLENKRYQHPRMELPIPDDEEKEMISQQEWFFSPLSTPAVITTLSHWLHGYEEGSCESNSIKEMLGHQVKRSIKDVPGFHLAVGLLCEDTIRAIFQLENVHHDKRNALFLEKPEDVHDIVPFTVRSICIPSDEQYAGSLLINLLSQYNNGALIVNTETQKSDALIRFNPKTLKQNPRWYFAVLYAHAISYK